MPTLGDYTVSVRAGGATRSEHNGYVSMEHGEQYSLYLRNNASTRCDATIRIDGKDMGTFRISQRSFVLLERPSMLAKQFHFYLSGTPKGDQAEITKGDSNNGHIEVQFLPERTQSVVNQSYCVTTNGFLGFERQATRAHTKEYRSCDSRSGNDDEMGFGFAEGGTGLEGRSNQTFNHVGVLSHDESRAVTIHLRLVGLSSQIEPLPGGRSTNLPPPLKNEAKHFW